MARFYEAPDWRFVVAGLGGGTKTFLDRICWNRQVTYTLGGSAEFQGDVPSDNPEVNILTAGVPFVTFNNRLIYGFRRENPNPGVLPPWVCRYAGILDTPNDECQPSSDQAITHITAHDPWTYLNHRPVVLDDGTLPGNKGVTITGKGPAVARQLLFNAIAAADPAAPFAAQNCFIDAGQTAFYTGHIGTSMPTTTFNFRQGMSVGEAWTQIVQTGNCDIVLTPIYDPGNRPGFLCQFNGYELAGSIKHAAIFSWDKAGRSLLGINRLQDGSAMGNVGQGYLGQGGAPRPRTAGQQTNAASIAKYGDYWLQQAFPAMSLDTGGPIVDAIMQAQVQLAAAGRTSVTVDLTPEFSPIPFEEFYLGDQVPLWASNNLRAPIFPVAVAGEWTNLHRVYVIPVTIPDDSPEAVSQLVVSPPLSIAAGE